MQSRGGIVDNPEPLHQYTKGGWLVMLVLVAAGIAEALLELALTKQVTMVSGSGGGVTGRRVGGGKDYTRPNLISSHRKSDLNTAR